MSAIKPEADEPLPSTSRFVAFLGVFIVVGWVLMFLLLRARW